MKYVSILLLCIAGCNARLAMTQGGTEAAGVIVQLTADDVVKDTGALAFIIKQFKEADMPSELIAEHVTRFVQSKEGSWELNDLKGCMEIGGRFEECLEFVNMVHGKDTE